MSEAMPPDLLKSGTLETLTLYIDLAPDTKADLEVVARASLAFASAVRELSFVLDPSLGIRIELVSGTEGSLSLNSLLRFFGKPDATARQNIKVIALAMATFFSVKTVEWTYERVLDHFIASEEQPSFSPEQIEQIIERTAATVARRVGAPQAERVYRELQTDPAVRGVTVAHGREVDRSNIVPRSEFGMRSGLIQQEMESATKRTRVEIVNLSLVSPVLLADTRRHWRFQSASGPLSAPVKDAQFLDDMINGRTAITLVSGIQMEVELRTVEEKKDGVWHVKERAILHVRQIRSPSQSSFKLVQPSR
jgi:hypothetical protein